MWKFEIQINTYISIIDEKHGDTCDDEDDDVVSSSTHSYLNRPWCQNGKWHLSSLDVCCPFRDSALPPISGTVGQLNQKLSCGVSPKRKGSGCRKQ